ncbi:DUF1579 domain-containing protein [Nitrosomonas sp. JL21]|uniref:DUF1579 domain-containing protein n=1 Tax=Nitrosomonas sp. JL21 TaxID=153949 RepID=UPI001368A4D0|nr:DUF1579 domain-containing protein [Nitrosomonas sp. JL21]MBL8497913.1 DUF1579 domain-containing protein [Nitrosomonas sp.]MCC7091763.1 DUF1579 domain-containing protein [Nitrosomonas sp.]MXS78256.1 DUF1579 domain-containing protein [Nitrosomonas sp. JL21]
MRYLSLIWIAVLFMLVATPIVADEKKSNKPMSSEEMVEIYTKLAAPGEPHRLLASLAGNWTTTTKEWMDPQKQPTESTGSVEAKMILGERFLQQQISGTMHGRPHTGIWTVGYDNLLKRYVSSWIDSMSTQIFMMDGTASADGRTITFTGQHAEVGGGHMSHRAVWKIVDGNNQEFVMYGAHHGAAEMKMMEVVYTRKN